MRTVRTSLSVILAGTAAACGGGSGSQGGGRPAQGSGPPPAATTAAGETPPGHPSRNLIPRDLLFGNPERTAVQISPDGAMLSWLAPLDGVLNVWVAPVDRIDQARSITADRKRPVRVYLWAFDGKHVLYQQDTGGDENWHIYSVEVATGKAVDLTPIEKVAARIEAVSYRRPGTVLIGLNDRNPQFHDVYTVDIASGKRELLLENEEFLGFVYDDDMVPRLALQTSVDGGLLIKKPGKQKATWDELARIGQEDSLTTQPIGFDKSGHNFFMWDSRGRNTAALVRLPASGDGKPMVLAEDARADGSDILMHPTENVVQAAQFTYERNEWKVLDKRVADDFARLEKLADGEFHVVGRTLDDRTWVVVVTTDAGPARYYLWDRPAKKDRFLFTDRPALEKLELARMKSSVIPSRDGLSLVSYLTLPVGSDSDSDGVPDRPQPMVLLVHGGPWARDTWGYHPIHQFLANRGYAVLSVNFRGSSGLGKHFINAGNREWAGKMHDDLLDAVDWAVKQRVADERRVCIMGGSYGGYATLVGLTFTPDVFACGVDIVGPSNLITLLNTIPPYWKPAIDVFKTRVGDWTTEEGKKFLLERSPISRTDRIAVPLLIGQGANDPRVKQAESDQIVQAMQGKKIPITYVLFPDEGHGFARQENNLAFWAVAEAFLSAYLGGSFQPLDAASFAGSTITVPVGATAVPELVAALPDRK